LLGFLRKKKRITEITEEKREHRDSGGVSAFDGEAETHDFEDGGEAAEGGIAFLREGAIELGRVEVCLLGYTLDSAKGFGHLTQGDEKLSLLAVFEDVVQEFERVGGVFLEQFCHGFVVGSVSDCG
jgi:hypothetical protein